MDRTLKKSEREKTGKLRLLTTLIAGQPPRKGHGAEPVGKLKSVNKRKRETDVSLCVGKRKNKRKG